MQLLPRIAQSVLVLALLSAVQGFRKIQTSRTAELSSSDEGSGSASANIKVVSYNLYWWNAFQQNPSKSDGIVNNIRNVLGADTIGMQECNSASTIQSRSGYSQASAFADNQGVSVLPGVFSVGETGSRNIGAEGFWGPRYVTWAQLTHRTSGRTFWHFNTHWCVQDCGSDKRYVGAQNMLNTIRERAGNAPVVITGDFNAGMTEPGIQHFQYNGFTLAATHWVDAIFYSTAHWSVVSTATGDAAGSDHRPVIATLNLGGSSSPSPSPSPSPPSGCTDNDTNCAYWAGQGYCSSSSEHYAYMELNCCASCNGGGGGGGGGNVYCNPSSNPAQYCPSGAQCPQCGSASCLCP